MRLSPKLLAFEVLAFLVFAMLAGVGFLAWRLTQGPIDLALVRPQVERSMADARGGQPVKIDSLALEWVRDRGRVEVAARGLIALDSSGGEVFRAERAAMSFEAAALISGRLKTQRIRLENGAATVVRSADGVWSLADIVLAREPTSGESAFDPLRDLNWQTLATPIRALVSAGSFERVELANFTVQVQDRKLNTVWGASPVEGLWTATPDRVSLDLDIKLVGAGEPNRVGIALSADGAVTTAVGELDLQGVDPMSIARMFGYSGQNFSSGSPANAAFSVEATEAGGLMGARLVLSGVNGRGRFAGADVSVSGLDLDAFYDPATKRLALGSLSIASDRVTGRFTGWAELAALMAGDAVTPVPFSLSAGEFTLGVTPMFEKPWAFKSASINGSLSPDMQRLIIGDLQAVTGEMSAQASGEVWLDGPAEGKLLGLKLEARGQGVATPQQVVDFWPVSVGADARTWVRDHILAGRATRAALTVDWPPGANSQGFLPDEHLTLDFDVTGATVKFLPDFPPATDVAGRGRLRGNSLTFDASSGSLRSWTADEARIALPRFHPNGAKLDIAVAGSGDLTTLMQVLEDSNLKVGTNYGLAVGQMTGTGGIQLNLQQTLGRSAATSDLDYSIRGGFRNVSAPDLAAGFGLVESDVRFDLTTAELVISGGGRFGPAPVIFSWRERFGDDGGSELTATARLNPDLLNAFGFVARNMMQGEVAVDLVAKGPAGRDFSSIAATMDLTHAALEISELGWRKRFDAPARGEVRYGRGATGGTIAGDIRSDGLELVGELKLDSAGDFESAFIERIFSRGTVDLRGGVASRPDGGLRLSLNGPYFDASPWVSNLFDTPPGSSAAAPADAGDGMGGPDEAEPALGIDIKTDRLKLRDNTELTNASVVLELDSQGPRSGRITGAIDATRSLDVRITPEGDVRRLMLRSDDAGFAVRALVDLNYFTGGRMTIDGVMDGGAVDARVQMTDVHMRQAPLVAQILAVASLRGLTDLLNGDGVLFTSVEMPMRVERGRISLPGLRASGPAMGITARGWMSPGSGDISLDGVLVPAFGVNSALGSLPLIGDLFVSRQGEGIFAPTYSVRGTMERARVTINPIAAMTPGVLRRIFENPAEDPPEIAAPRQ